VTRRAHALSLEPQTAKLARETMLVTKAQPADRNAIAESAELSGVQLDVAGELDREWSLLWIARDEPGDRRVSAFLLAWHVVDELHVIDLATRPDRRRRGFARALVDHLLSYASKTRARLVLLEVRRSNQAAQCLYRDAGFAAVSVRRDYYSGPAEDAIQMQLAFDPQTGEPTRQPDEIALFEP
jgi:ribosomal-protein-alanine N-acetyltransferase